MSEELQHNIREQTRSVDTVVDGANLQEQEGIEESVQASSPFLQRRLGDMPPTVFSPRDFGYLQREFQFAEGLDKESAYVNALKSGELKKFACYDSCDCESTRCPT